MLQNQADPAAGGAAAQGDFWAGVKEKILAPISENAGEFLIGLGILLVGWLLAKFISKWVEIGLKKTEVDDKIAAFIVGEEKAKAHAIETIVSKTVYILLMILVVVQFFRQINLEAIAGPFEGFLDEISQYLPNVVGGIILIGIAWLAAKILSRLTSKAIEMTKIDKAVETKTGAAIENGKGIAKTLGMVVFGLVILFFIPGILEAFGLQNTLGSVKEMVTKIMQYLPNILGAVGIFVIGWYVAKILRDIVTNLFASMGADKLGEKIGMQKVLGKKSLSGILGLVLYVIILVPVVIQSLETLGLETFSKPATETLEQMWGAVPKVLSAGFILLLAYVAGKIVGGIVSNLLSGIGFNNLFEKLGLGNPPKTGDRSLSSVAGTLVLVAIMIFAAETAAEQLGWDALKEQIGSFLAFGKNVLLGLVIIGLGLFLGRLAHRSIEASGSTHSGLLGRVAWVAIVILGVAIGLQQMIPDPEIVKWAFIFLGGSIAVAAAIAFGVGGREIAGTQLKEWVAALKKKK